MAESQGFLNVVDAIDAAIKCLETTRKMVLENDWKLVRVSLLGAMLHIGNVGKVLDRIEDHE